MSLPSFPLEHFGKLFGLVMALSAIVSLLQFPIFTFIKGTLKNDPFYVSIVGRGMASSLRPARTSRLGCLRGAPARGAPNLAEMIPAGRFLHMAASLVLFLKLGYP